MNQFWRRLGFVMPNWSSELQWSHHATRAFDVLPAPSLLVPRSPILRSVRTVAVSVLHTRAAVVQAGWLLAELGQSLSGWVVSDGDAGSWGCEPGRVGLHGKRRREALETGIRARTSRWSLQWYTSGRVRVVPNAVSDRSPLKLSDYGCESCV